MTQSALQYLDGHTLLHRSGGERVPDLADKLLEQHSIDGCRPIAAQLEQQLLMRPIQRTVRHVAKPPSTQRARHASDRAGDLWRKLNNTGRSFRL